MVVLCVTIASLQSRAANHTKVIRTIKVVVRDYSASEKASNVVHVSLICFYVSAHVAIETKKKVQFFN